MTPDDTWDCSLWPPSTAALRDSGTVKDGVAPPACLGGRHFLSCASGLQEDSRGGTWTGGVLIFGTRVLQKGDVTGDGVIDAVDASAVLSEYALTSTDKPSSFNVEQVIAADYDNNTAVNAVDASLILAKYAENAVKH